MLGTEGFVDIQVLRRQGMSIKGIARELGISRNTVRSYLRTDTAPVFKPNPSRSSKLDPFKDYLQLRVAAAHPDWIPATVLFDETQGQRIYRGYHDTERPYGNSQAQAPSRSIGSL